MEQDLPAHIQRPALTEYYFKHERLNVITHGFGLLLSVIGLILLLYKAIEHGGWQRILGFSLFGGSLIAAYAASTLFHNTHTIILKHRLRIADHAAIYLLIAGSYSPFAIITIGGTKGWLLFGGMWTVALIGVVFKLFFTGKYDVLSTIIYVAMGWSAILVARPMVESLPNGGLWLLILGGVAYCAGLIFYFWDNLKFNHAIWHLFVLAGSLSHFFAIIIYV